MARIKNALTTYEVAPIVDDVSAAEWVELGPYIHTVTDATEDETEEQGYYDGDGTPEDNVNGTKVRYEFQGYYDEEDAGQLFIKSLKHKKGKDRHVLLQVTEPNGTKEVAKATVTNIIARGGEATAYPVFSCTISLNEEPTITQGEGAEV